MPTPLRRLRTDAGLSLEALAAASGVSRNTVWRIEQGGYVPYPATRKKIADVLGCLPSEIAEFADGDSRGVPPDQHR